MALCIYGLTQLWPVSSYIGGGGGGGGTLAQGSRGEASIAPACLFLAKANQKPNGPAQCVGSPISSTCTKTGSMWPCAPLPGCQVYWVARTQHSRSCRHMAQHGRSAVPSRLGRLWRPSIAMALKPWNRREWLHFFQQQPESRMYYFFKHLGLGYHKSRMDYFLSTLA